MRHLGGVTIKVIHSFRLTGKFKNLNYMLFIDNMPAKSVLSNTMIVEWYLRNISLIVFIH